MFWPNQKQSSLLAALLLACLTPGLAHAVGTADSVNLGIGTATPKSRLDVNGSLAVGASYAATVTAPTNGAIIQGTVGIATSSPTAGTILDLGSATGTSRSSLLLPKDTATNRPSSPVSGMLRYNSTDNIPEYYNGTTWNVINGSTGNGIPGCGDTNTLSSPAMMILTVATGCTVLFKLWGGGGGAAGAEGSCAAAGASGGGGGYASITLGPLVSTTDYYLFVGGGGGGGGLVNNSLPGGGGLAGSSHPNFRGGAGAAGGTSQSGGGGGGGASGVWTGSFGGTPVAIAGGGGGAAASSNGCGSIDQGGMVAGTGTQTSGTAGQDASANKQGGGGGGYSTGGATGGQAGGGLSYVQSGNGIAYGVNATAANPSDANRPSNAGNGGTGVFNAAGNSGNAGAIYYYTY